MYRNVKEYFYTFGDVVKGLANVSEIKIDNVPTFATCFGYLFNSATPTIPSEMAKLFETLVIRNTDYYCVDTIKEAETQSDFQEVARCLGQKIWSIFIDTKPYYSRLLTLYEGQETHFLDKLKSESDFINRFNDTPENGGVFSDDEHTSNITQGHSETSNDVTTIMARIDEIQRLYKNVLSKWADEFNGLFTNPLNFD